MSVTPLIVRGYSLSGRATGHLFVPYVYNGTERATKRPKPTTDRICTLDGCAGQHHAKGLCSVHYRKAMRGGELGADNRRRPFDPSRCGTLGGYSRHRNHQVPICQACRDAKNRYDRERRARTGAKK
jgi:hypothetical protein